MGGSGHKTCVIERGGRYELEGYGEVQVTGISRRIDAVDEDGVVDATIRVRLNINPDSDFTTNRDIKKLDLDAVIRSLEKDTEQ